MLLSLVALAVWYSKPTRDVEVSSPHPVDISGTTMGTYYRVHASSPAFQSENTVKALHERAEALLAEVNRQMSTYISDSEISQFNLVPENVWFEISSDFYDVLTISNKIVAASSGAFDPTVGRLVEYWGFGKDKIRPKSFANADLEREVQPLLANSGWQFLERKAEGNTFQIMKTRPIHLDVSAVAKGYGVDKLLLELRDEFKADYINVEIGGEFREWGAKSEQQTFSVVGVEQPSTVTKANQSHPTVRKLFRIDDQAIATSGSYRNFYEHEGRNFAHAIDPRTGFGVNHAMVSVSVIAETCAEADAWATAFLVLGPEKTKEIATKKKMPVYLIESLGDNRFGDWLSPEALRLEAH